MSLHYRIFPYVTPCKTPYFPCFLSIFRYHYQNYPPPLRKSLVQLGCFRRQNSKLVIGVVWTKFFIQNTWLKIVKFQFTLVQLKCIWTSGIFQFLFFFQRFCVKNIISLKLLTMITTIRVLMLIIQTHKKHQFSDDDPMVNKIFVHWKIQKKYHFYSP